jgi:chromate reductase, NAD(P)H dehydrogenase (quinone)
LGASPGFTGTARAQMQLRQTFIFSGACAVVHPEVLVGRAAEKFDAAGRLTDEPTREYIGKLLEALRVLTHRLRVLV